MLRGDISENHFSFIIFHPRKISSLMTELQALKQEKGDTEEARKVAEEEIAKMKKDHEEKVLIFVSSRFLLLLCVLFIDYYYRDFFVWTEWWTFLFRTWLERDDCITNKREWSVILIQRFKASNSTTKLTSESLYGIQFTLQLTTRNYLVILPTDTASQFL